VKTVIVAGFGAFDGIVDNPSAAIADALDGCVLGNISVFGREMPVSYSRSVEVCRMWLESTQAVAIVGIGVAMSRERVTVERTARLPIATDHEDVDGQTDPGCAVDSPMTLTSTMPVNSMAQVLGAVVGDDAGNFVCNGWFYKALEQFEVDVGFIHIPPNGLDTGKLLHGLYELWGDDSGE